ncbi:MAG: ATP-binding cassette domain-containing protein [Butyrivibrio sp.]|nr:ATP-binding cassette domain-containing protein [Butyrivibrio sp.]
MTNRDNNIHVLWKIMQMLEEEQIEAALTGAFEALLQAVGADTGAIWLLNPDTNRVISAISVGESSVAGFTIEKGQGIVGEAMSGSEPLIIMDVSSDPRFPGGKDDITGETVKNVFLMPMILRKEVIGCVEILDKSEGEKYDEAEMSLIHSFAGLLAMVIDERGYSYSDESERKVIMSLRDIIKDYPSGQETAHILKGVDLDIYENELLVILGESGCGKTTLLNIIGGMDQPTDGQITFDGKDYSKPTEKQLTDFRRDDVGFIFQSYNLMPNLTALENVKFIAEICKNPSDPEEAIEMVGLSDRAGNYPSMMSGGQQQRVSIARAIVKRPRLILADEPTAALDFATGQEVLELIEDLIRKKITTVVMVTHNVEIARMANRVVRVKDGKISSIRINAWPMHASELVW